MTTTPTHTTAPTFDEAAAMRAPHTSAPTGSLRRWFGPLVHARTWKETAAHLLTLPLGIVTSTVTVVLWTVAATLAAFPAYGLWSGTEDVPDALSGLVHGWGRVGTTVAVTTTGIVLLAVTPRVVHAMAALHRRIIGRLLAA